MKFVLFKMNELNDFGWIVCYEVIYYGLSEFDVLSFFIEIGLSEEEWVNDRVGEIVVEIIIYVFENY